MERSFEPAQLFRAGGAPDEMQPVLSQPEKPRRNAISRSGALFQEFGCCCETFCAGLFSEKSSNSS
jgi:hypothetical protein